MCDMRIAMIAHNCRAGGGLFGTLNLMKGIAAVAQNHKFLLIYPASCGYENIKLPEGSKYVQYSKKHNPVRRLWYERTVLPKIVSDFGADIIFGVGNTGLINPHSPQVLFIRQAYLIYKKSEHRSHVQLRLKLRLWELYNQVKKSLPKTDMIFTQTPVAAERFAEAFSYPIEKIKVLRLPPPEDIICDESRPQPEVFYKNKNCFFFLLLTRYLPHRNPSVLIPLCKKYAQVFRNQKIRFIVTLDKDSPFSVNFLKKVYQYKFEDIILDLGVIPRNQAAQYYRYSNVLWLPTMLETLGFPFLEAMSYQLPILVPDLDFSRYVCGKAAAYYDPWDLESLYNNIIKIKEDKLFYKTLKEAASKELNNHEKFAKDWSEVAHEILLAFESIKK